MMWRAFFLFLISFSVMAEKAPYNFVYVTDVAPLVIENPRYKSAENFMKRPVPGYHMKRMICTLEAAEALKKVSEAFQKEGYYILLYDAYRPQSAVNAFILWSKNTADDKGKNHYYPSFDKKDLFKFKYIDNKSGHSRGSTFDLTLISADKPIKPVEIKEFKLNDGTTIPFLDDNSVDMGSSFDLLHKASNHDSPLIPEVQTKMRNKLRSAMEREGFVAYDKEWWHYTLKNEPYPDRYFDFIDLEKKLVDVKAELQHLKAEIAAEKAAEKKREIQRTQYITPVFKKLETH